MLTLYGKLQRREKISVRCYSDICRLWWNRRRQEFGEWNFWQKRNSGTWAILIPARWIQHVMCHGHPGKLTDAMGSVIIRQGENSGNDNNELGHYAFDIGDNNNNPILAIRRVGSGPWIWWQGIIQRSRGPHMRWVIPAAMVFNARRTDAEEQNNKMALLLKTRSWP